MAPELASSLIPNEDQRAPDAYTIVLLLPTAHNLTGGNGTTAHGVEQGRAIVTFLAHCVLR